MAEQCEQYNLYVAEDNLVLHLHCFNCLSLLNYRSICTEIPEGSLSFPFFCQTSPVSNSKTESRYGLDPQLLPSVVNELSFLFCDASIKTAQVWLHHCCFVSACILCLLNVQVQVIKEDKIQWEGKVFVSESKSSVPPLSSTQCTLEDRGTITPAKFIHIFWLPSQICIIFFFDASGFFSHHNSFVVPLSTLYWL